MRILAVERSGLYYGSAVNLRNWIEHYVKVNNASVDVLLGESGEIEEHLEEVGAQVKLIGLPGFLNRYGKKNIKGVNLLLNALALFFYNFKCFFSVRKDYDVLVVNNYRSAVYYLLFLILIKLFSKSKIVIRFQISQTPVKIAFSLVKSIADKIIVHGTEGYCKREFGEDFEALDKVVCIPNPVNTEKYRFNEVKAQQIRRDLKIPEEAFVFLSVCYIEPRKGVLQLVESFKRADLKNCYLVHIGDHGSHQEYFDKVIGSAGPNTLFLGKKSNVQDYYSCADVFVLNSAYEGMPYVIVEAMSSGLPIISTYSGSNVEVVTKDVGALLEYDDNAALIETLSYYANNRDLCERMGQNARERVAALYSERVYFETLAEVY